MIYVGPRDDYGYNQAQAEAAAELKKMAGVKVVEEENVPETAAVQKTMTGMIAQDGASLVFPTSFGYFDPHMLAVAAKYPDVRFAHCGGMWTEGKHPKNAGSFFGYIDECQYLNGVIAGHMTQEQEDRLHRRQADPAGAAQHQRLHAGRALGQARHHHQRDLHRRLVDAGQGSRSHQQPGRPGRRRVHDARRRPEGDRRDRGQARQDGLRLPRQPGQAGAQAYLTGAEWNWLTAYTTFIEAARSGKPHPNFLRGGLKDGFVKMSRLRPGGDGRGEEGGRRRQGPDDGGHASTSSRAR